MNDTIKTDYLIVGQGIAGTLFAHELEKQGHTFMVIDSGDHNASKTAAGMYNPVVLKRFSPVWQGTEQIVNAKQTIAELETLLHKKLDYPMPIMRIFHDEDEKVTWRKKSNTAELSGLLSRQFIENNNEHIVAPFGFGEVRRGGKVDVKQLLESYRSYLVDTNRLLHETLDYSAMDFDEECVRYKNIVAKTVVCCEGYGIKENPYFNELPLKGNKGEVLLIKAPGLSITAAIKSKVFIMPMAELGNDIYFVGATYNWTDKDCEPTLAARRELLEKLSQFIAPSQCATQCDDSKPAQADSTRGDSTQAGSTRADSAQANCVANETDGIAIEVIAHHAGMRPTVIDRRPLLGKHIQHDNLYILNGLGTRGVMLGAAMSKMLYQHIEYGSPLLASVDIKRFAGMTR